MARLTGQDEALQRFLHRVWRDDVAPLLRGHRSRQRERLARAGGTVAGTTGRAIDSLLRLRGKPFTRALTVMGSSLGAVIPDAWDWGWLRRANRSVRKVAAQRLQRQAQSLPETEALGLFGLPPTASREQFRDAWRETSKRWHPDRAADDQQRGEYHLRFVAYQALRERIEAAYDAGRLPAR
jgi:hypothetical protein